MKRTKLQFVMGIAGEGLGQALNAVLDTGAGPKFVRKRDLLAGFEIYDLPNNIPRVVGASADGVKLSGATELSIQVGGLKTREWVIATKNIPVPLILGSAYMDEHGEHPSPKLCFKILFDGTTANLGAIAQSSQTVRCHENCVIPAQSVMFVPVVSEYRELGVVSKGSKGRGGGILANSLADFPGGHTGLYLQCSNFLDWDLHSVKRLILVKVKPAKTVAMKVTSERAVKLWKKTIDLMHLDGERTEAVQRTLWLFEEMWSGKLGAICKQGTGLRQVCSASTQNAA